MPIKNFKTQGEFKILEKYIKYLDKREFITFEPSSKPNPAEFPLEIIDLDSPEK